MFLRTWTFLHNVPHGCIPLQGQQSRVWRPRAPFSARQGANTRLMLLIWPFDLEFRIWEGPFAWSTSPHECPCNATPRAGLCGFRAPCTVHVPPIPLVPRALWKYRRMAPIPCVVPSTHRTTPTHFPGGTVVTASPRASGSVSRRPQSACITARGGYENRFHSVPSSQANGVGP